MSSVSREIRKGRNAALQELQGSFLGPLEGLRIAPEFFKLLQSPALRNTPLGRSLQLQQQVLGETSAALGGEPFGRRGRGAGALPPDLVTAIGEQVGGSAGAAGIAGSPAAALKAAIRFTGASESIRQQRISSALNVLQTVGQGSIAPSASQFLEVGARKASQAADIQFQAGNLLAQARAAKDSARGKLLGTALGLGIGAATGGLGLLPGLAGGFGGALVGGGVGSGLLPTGAFNFNFEG